MRCKFIFFNLILVIIFVFISTACANVGTASETIDNNTVKKTET